MAESNNPTHQTQDYDGFSISFLDFVANVIYYRKIFFIVASAIFALGLVYAIFATPIYKTDVLIQVEDKKSSALSGALQDVSKAFEVQNSPVVGQIEIFKSRSVIGRAVESLFLHTDVTVNNHIPLISNLVYRLISKTPEGLAIPPISWLDFSWGGEDLIFGTYNIPAKYLTKPLFLIVGEQGTWNLYNKDDELLATGKVGVETLSENGQWQINIKTLRANPGTEFKLVRYSLQSRIEQINGGLNAVEAGRQSGLFRATYAHPNPAFAQRLLNAVAQSYVDQNTERQAEEAEKSLKFLSKKLPELAEKMNEAETAFSNFRNRESTIDVPGEIKAILEQSVTIEKERMLAEIKRSEMAQRYEPLHPFMKAINSQLVQLKAENSALEKQINALPQTQQAYLSYARDAEISAKLYESLLDTSQQLQVTKAGTVGNVAVIDYAVIPESPDQPNKKFIVSLGGVLGVLLGAIFVNIIGFMFGKAQDPKKLEEATGLKMMAIVPFSSEQAEVSKAKETHEPFLLSEVKPNVTTIEALRSLRVAVQFALHNKPRQKVVLITSAIPGQGKSFISANLAHLFAASGKKTLVIDADIRRSTLRRYYPISNAMGLSEVLQEKATLEEVLIRDIKSNLDIIPAGGSTSQPGELLMSERIKEILEWSAQEYELVLIDSSPILAAEDSAILSRLSDLTFLVCRYDDVTTHEVKQSIESYGKSGANVDALVFNSFVKPTIFYGAYRYGYYRYGYKGGYLSTTDHDTTEIDNSSDTNGFIDDTTGATYFKNQIKRTVTKLRIKLQKRLTEVFRNIRH